MTHAGQPVPKRAHAPLWISLAALGLALALQLVAANSVFGASGQAIPEALKRLDACSLLSSKDIQIALGAPLQETRPSSPPGGGSTYVSQCVLLTSSPAKSVSLSVTIGLDGRASIRQFWRQAFHSTDPAHESETAEQTRRKKIESSRLRRAENEVDEGSEPRRVAGLGEEAYWVGNSVAGALYVLKGSLFIRLSIGGVASQSDRLEKSKHLAKAALLRVGS